MRRIINILLIGLIALLSGCKAQQGAAKQENRPTVLYGPPSMFQDSNKP